MAEPASEIKTSVKNFGHCIVSWKIKNFSLAMCNPETEIFTRDFTVSSSKVTRWRVGFRVESDTSKLRIVLIRIGDASEKSFKVSWKMTILNGKNEATFVSEDRTDIHVGSEHKIDVISPLDILKALPAEKSDEANITFQMIVLMNDSRCIPTPKDEVYTALTDDMKVIAKEGFLSDLTVMLNYQTMKTHRAILLPRIKKMYRSAGCQIRKIQLYLSDVDAVNSIFAYLYTGNLKHVLEEPSITIYDYIVHLDIKELRDVYPQEKISMETVIEAVECEFRWTIQDFTSSDELRESEIYEGDGTKWQLRIYPKGLNTGTELQRKYVYIEALAVNSERPQDVYVNFIAKNDKGLITVAKRTYGTITSGKKLGVFFMRIGGSSMAKSVVDNVLDIYFSVHTATGKINSTIIETSPPVPLNLTNFNTYKILTNYLGLLQSDNIYSDITLVVQDQEIKAHKFILGGRSVTLSRMIEGMKNDSTILPLPKMNKHVFRVFLDYLYRSVVTDVEISVLVHLHDVAVHFLVKSLQNLCIKNLAGQLTPENCCYLLLFAEDRHSASLKTHTLRYIAAYRELIINNAGWINMEQKNPQLFFDVVSYLGNETTEPPAQSHDVQRQG